MKKEFKSILLAGIGSAAYTYEKASSLVDNLVEKGKLTLDEGKELSEELKRNIKSKTEVVKNKAEDIKPVTKQDIAELLNEMNFASNDEVTSLKQRIINLEEKIDNLNKQ
ncbi:phasin family protein [Haloimpatiens sp. FM7330]|uniref:phasin family protein n=1 Tax=Haloimpatiens sp. FM7330 TaxID=3298610 RepID=UPI00362D4FE9